MPEVETKKTSLVIPCQEVKTACVCGSHSGPGVPAGLADSKICVPDPPPYKAGVVISSTRRLGVSVPQETGVKATCST